MKIDQSNGGYKGYLEVMCCFRKVFWNPLILGIVLRNLILDVSKSQRCVETLEEHSGVHLGFVAGLSYPFTRIKLT